jgi:hypothetical protein
LSRVVSADCSAGRLDVGADLLTTMPHASAVLTWLRVVEGPLRASLCMNVCDSFPRYDLPARGLCGRLLFKARSCLCPTLRGRPRTVSRVRARDHFARHRKNLSDRPADPAPLHNQDYAWPKGQVKGTLRAGSRAAGIRTPRRAANQRRHKSRKVSPGSTALASAAGANARAFSRRATAPSANTAAWRSSNG